MGLALPAQCQLPLSFGLMGGARLTDFTQSTSDVSTQDHVYTIGPYAAINLPLGFSLEADLLYSKSASTLSAAASGLLTPRQYNFDSFQLPILAKKHFGKKVFFFRPFVDAGLANRYSTGLPGTTIGSSTTSGWQEGLLIGGGVEFKILILKISAELRWTRYGNISASTLPRLNANEAELLLALGL
jgi:hypothetical protein